MKVVRKQIHRASRLIAVIALFAIVSATGSYWLGDRLFPVSIQSREELSHSVGRRVRVIGLASNFKDGAYLATPYSTLGLSSISSFPDDIVDRRIEVTGVVELGDAPPAPRPPFTKTWPQSGGRTDYKLADVTWKKF